MRLVMLPSGDVELTLGAEERGNVAQMCEPVVQGVDKSDVGTRVVQIGLKEGSMKPESMIH